MEWGHVPVVNKETWSWPWREGGTWAKAEGAGDLAGNAGPWGMVVPAEAPEVHTPWTQHGLGCEIHRPWVVVLEGRAQG